MRLFPAEMLRRHIPVGLGAADHLVKPVDAEHLRRTIANTVAEQPRPPRRILVVDGDPGLRELLSADLTGLGYEVTTVPNAEGALDAIQHQGADLAIIDVTLPTMSGLQLVRRLRESGGDPASLPVIVYSEIGLGEESVWLEAMVDAVVPHASPSALLREMERIMGGPAVKPHGSDH